MVPSALAAAGDAANDGISVEVIDLRTIYPWDTKAVVTSVEKTGRLLAVQEPQLTGGVAAEVAAYVAESLYHRARGYVHEEDKIFQHEGMPVIVPTMKHYAPDTNACSLWLRNRQPDKWRDQKNISLHTEMETPETTKELQEGVKEIQKEIKRLEAQL